MRCETCGKSYKETPIVEKPFRFAFQADVVYLDQNTGDQRKQENICLPCLTEEVERLKESCKPEMVKITLKNNRNLTR